MREPEHQCHHGWRGAATREPIRTPCPSCGGQLFIGEGGHLTCAVLSCKNPDVEEVWKNLRERLDTEKQCRDVNKASVVHTVGGTVEGKPTHEGNFLQRLRELVEKEGRLEAAEQKRDELIHRLSIQP